MREKIKLKSKNKNNNISQKKETLSKGNEFNCENNIIKETEENNSEKYEKILVNKNIFYNFLINVNIYIYSQKKN